MKRILIDDWTARNKFGIRTGKRYLKLGEYSESDFTDIIEQLEEKLPLNLKLKVVGRYNCGYGIPFGEEDYNMTIMIKEKQPTLLQEHFSKPIYSETLIVKKDLDFYYEQNNASEISELIIDDFFDKNQSFRNVEPVES